MKRILFVDNDTFKVGKFLSFCGNIFFHSDITRNILFFLLLYGFFLLPLVLADYKYIDDKGRSSLLYLYWSLNGRPLADFAIIGLVWSRDAFDIAPLPQILAIIALAIASAWISQALFLTRRSEALCIAFLVCNPFFLENISYQYDSFSMSLAVLVSVLPFLFIKKILTWRYFLLSLFCSFIVLNLYQPAINIFIIMALYIALLGCARQDSIAALLGLAQHAAACVAAVFLYQPASRLFISGEYSSRGSELTSSSSVIATNASVFWTTIKSILLGAPQSWALIVALGLGAVASVALGIRYGQSQRIFAIIGRICLLGTIVLVMSIAVVGPMILLAAPIFDNRVMIGFGMLVACMTCSIVLISRQTILEKSCVFFLSAALAGQVFLSFAYGNILAEQSRFEAALARQIAEDVFTTSGRDHRVLAVRGTAPYPPSVRRTLERLETVRKLVRSPLNWHWIWGAVLLQNHGLSTTVQFAGDGNDLLTREDVRALLQAPCDGRVAARRIDYDLLEAGTVLLLDFELTCR